MLSMMTKTFGTCWWQLKTTPIVGAPGRGAKIELQKSVRVFAQPGSEAQATATRHGDRFLENTGRRRPGSRRLVLMWWTAPAPGIEVP
jgi:hypothetical protein